MKKLPVVIGSGIAGLSVSYRLSQAKIQHILIGELVHQERPCLGESMDGVGTLELNRTFKELNRTYYAKNEVVFYNSNFRAVCSLDFRSSLGVRYFLYALGLPIIGGLYHVDRAKFDHPLSKMAIESSYCEHISSQVESIDYNDNMDEVTQIHLSCGQSIEASFAFDCTNHVRVLPRMIGISHENLGRKQSAAFTHFKIKNLVNASDNSWRLATSLIRTYPNSDGIDGFGWVIPMGDYLSIGISVDEQNGDTMSKEHLIQLFIEACKKRGIQFSDYIEESFPIRAISSMHYRHASVTGRNWVLSGTTACQIWFSSGTGVGSALFCASLAPKFLQGDEQAKKVYNEYIDSLVATHKTINILREGVITPQVMVGIAKKIFIANGERLSLYAYGTSGFFRRKLIYQLRKMVSAFAERSNFCEIKNGQRNDK